MLRSIVAVYLRQPGDGWPMDIGDDPSFAHAHKTGGQVTWGVCRTRLRNSLAPGDFVVFFAADRLADRRPATYYWVGFATVERKVSRTDIFEGRKLREYRGYPNLLIRRSAGRSGVYEHHEPTLEKPEWHRDWLWRLVKSAERKDAFLGATPSEYYDPKRTCVAGAPVKLASNYVIFAPEGRGTWIASRPPPIATASTSGSTETWLATSVARELKGLLLGEQRAARESLRTTSPQRAHPHLVLSVNPSELRRELEELALKHRISARRRGGTGVQTSRPGRRTC